MLCWGNGRGVGGGSVDEAEAVVELGDEAEEDGVEDNASEEEPGWCEVSLVWWCFSVSSHDAWSFSFADRLSVSVDVLVVECLDDDWCIFQKK